MPSVLVLEDDQASYGVAQFDQTDGIPELCRALGLFYRLFDDGRYEYDGSEETWVPGHGITPDPFSSGQRNRRLVGRRVR